MTEAGGALDNGKGGKWWVRDVEEDKAGFVRRVRGNMRALLLTHIFTVPDPYSWGTLGA